MRSVTIALFLFVSIPVFALPNESDFHINPNIPQPAPPASSVVGCSLPDSRYLLWNGNAVFIQHAPGSGVFDQVASGYLGDPSFAVLSFDQDYVLLGQGFGNGVTANVYPFNFNSPQNYQSGDEIVVPNHYWGTFLSSTLVAFDRGDFGSPAEIIVVDISGSRSAQAPVTVLRRPESSARDTIITKPVGSFSASVVAVGGTLYVADAGNGQYKSFPVADVITAYNTSSTINWSAGTDIGTPFSLPMNGVAGVTAGGNLVMSGFGSIAEVDPGTGNILNSIDPAGTGPFYGIIYNDTTEDFIAIEFSAIFGDPLIFHTTQNGVAALPAANAWGLSAAVSSIVAGALCLMRRRRIS